MTGWFSSEGRLVRQRLPSLWLFDRRNHRKTYYTTPHALLPISKRDKAWSACVCFKDAINLRLEFITAKHISRPAVTATHFIDVHLIN